MPRSDNPRGYGLLLIEYIDHKLAPLRSAIGMLEWWNNGPPWRDKNVTGLLLCINSVTEALVLNSIKSGLGQGTMGFGKMGHSFIGKILLDMGVRNIKI